MTVSSSPSPTAIPSLRDLAAPYFLSVKTLSETTSVAVEDAVQPPNPPRVNSYDTFNVFVNRAAARRKFLEDRKRANIVVSEGAAQEEPTVHTVTKTVGSSSREKDTTPTLAKRTEDAGEMSTKPSAEKTGKTKRGLNPAAVVFQPAAKVLEESSPNVGATRHSPGRSCDHPKPPAGFEKVMDWNSGTAAGWCESDFPLSEFCKDDEDVD